eukprot:GHVS01015845.1.p1 GENE.GHVS01015845.1~~GHVS01015845.1.p1  ORF type:complete len:291 (+),score=64.30 GHVS01015845.1:410-1282(+)
MRVGDMRDTKAALTKMLEDGRQQLDGLAAEVEDGDKNKGLAQAHQGKAQLYRLVYKAALDINAEVARIVANEEGVSNLEVKNQEAVIRHSGGGSSSRRRKSKEPAWARRLRWAKEEAAASAAAIKAKKLAKVTARLYKAIAGAIDIILGKTQMMKDRLMKQVKKNLGLEIDVAALEVNNHEEEETVVADASDEEYDSNEEEGVEPDLSALQVNNHEGPSEETVDDDAGSNEEEESVEPEPSALEMKSHEGDMVPTEEVEPVVADDEVSESNEEYDAADDTADDTVDVDYD